ncbi:HNH endonuclease [Sphaerospermopsis sp. LEGE 00249]|uniref:HNH endonuclease n=1 Tax=Sphaerospermopsis sp. LEGE 00249 TaxID=1380707 RepID=UPI00164DFCC3|nr:HNH endonuclease signature motif containing protein [Sphaerospermopsis sp. LEGE 00249]MBC5796854.1 HNH endonuclease [Sphaerospermopsis sp. LEGE 00249]
MTNNLISANLRQLVIERAQGRCEYCLIHQNFSIYSHEIDHIIAVKHGGKTLSENLALSCLPCNRHKGSDFATLDPKNGEIIRLFNPRLQIWTEHFTIKKGEIIGITSIGEATSRLLMFNTASRVRSRQLLITQKLYYL